MNKPLTLTAMLVIAALVLPALSGSVQAASARITKPVSQAHVAKLQKRAIAQKTRRLKNLTKKINAEVKLVQELQGRGVDVMVDNQARARLYNMARQQANLKRDLVRIKGQNVQQYAASRNIPLIPAPPTSAPPPLPPGPAPSGTASTGLLSVPTAQPQAGKAFLPPNSSGPTVTIDAGI